MEKIAVLIPCYNEEQTIGKVISDFKKELPNADIYVFDNNSKDKTVEIAKKSGAIVCHEYKQGKGNVIRTMFLEIEADYYIMVDGDDTYPSDAVHKLLAPVISGKADMCIGDRLSNGTYKKENTRPFHQFGNNIVKKVINILFQTNLKDIMTGYRCFNKKFVKNIPVMAKGFEIETEMTIYALDKRFAIVEIPIDYRNRPVGSVSKLNTINDGIKVFKTIINMLRIYRPLIFFTILAIIMAIISLYFGIPVIIEYYKTKFIRKIPSAVLASACMILAVIIAQCGIILDTVIKVNQENYQLNLLRYNQIEKKNKLN
ncbi:MAG: glycosyltransferase [Clostridia bacterium]|nr:glycosyltransferase [Clostridia bacterium]